MQRMFVSDHNERTARPELKKPDTRPITGCDAANERVASTDLVALHAAGEAGAVVTLATNKQRKLVGRLTS